MDVEPSRAPQAPEESRSSAPGSAPSRPLERAFDEHALAARIRPFASPVRLRLMHYLAEPHYLEEVARHLGLTRQAARRHLRQLVAAGVLERRVGEGPHGPVTLYALDPAALFLLQDDLERLGALRRRVAPRGPARTLSQDGPGGNGARLRGPCLLLVGGPHAGLSTPLAPGPAREWVLGRDARCEVALPHDPFVSQRHAAVRWDGQRHLLRDLRSLNGTERNWEPLASGGELALRHGDVVGAGRSLLLYWRD